MFILAGLYLYLRISKTSLVSLPRGLGYASKHALFCGAAFDLFSDETARGAGSKFGPAGCIFLSAGLHFPGITVFTQPLAL